MIKGTVSVPGMLYGTNDIETRAYQLVPGQTMKVAGATIDQEAIVSIASALRKAGNPVTEANIAAVWKARGGK